MWQVKLLDTFAAASYLELDYRHEARNQQRFRDELTPRLGGRRWRPPSPGVWTIERALLSASR